MSVGADAKDLLYNRLLHPDLEYELSMRYESKTILEAIRRNEAFAIWDSLRSDTSISFDQGMATISLFSGLEDEAPKRSEPLKVSKISLLII